MCVRVVNVKGMNTPAKRAGVCYVGRAWAGWPRSPLHNPFRPGEAGEDVASCLERYRAHLLAMPDLERQLELLWQATERGKKPLGCWCTTAAAGDRSPVVCHAQLLAAMLQERFCKQCADCAERDRGEIARGT